MDFSRRKYGGNNLMRKIYNSFIMALSMFTIIPTPYIEWDDESSKNMMKFYPVIGLIVGAIWSLIYVILSIINCTIMIKTTVIMIVPFIITGMLHLDGYCDVCDAILSRREKEEKLRILKDSHIGAFAVISLIILFFLQFSGVYSFLEKNIDIRDIICLLILIPVISRSLAGYFLLSKITIKESSLGTYFKKGTNKVDIIIMIGVIILSTICIFINSGLKYSIIPLTMTAIVTVGVRKCIKEFGGGSGDVAGFALIIGEAAGLITLGIM